MRHSKRQIQRLRWWLGGTAAAVALTSIGAAAADAAAHGTVHKTAAHRAKDDRAKDGTPDTVTLTFGSYSTTKDVYEDQIFPAFQRYWKQKTGQTVIFKDSYDASGAESRAIASGLPVDVAALSLADDIDRIKKAGYITHDWQNDPYHGMVTDSIVAIGVRKGNPKHIRDWTDLAKPGVVVDLPNPQTSGGAKWDITAIYGAGLKRGSAADAKKLLASIVRNVKVLDKSGEASMTTFLNGIGDAVVGYEDDILRESHNRRDFTEVIPKATLLIENPVAVIDKNVDAHGNRQVAEAFVAFLRSPVAQRIFAANGFRPVNPAVWNEVKSRYTTPPQLFTIASLGGWAKVNQTLFAQGAIFDQVLAERK
ncbi:sulfate-binding protein [Alicyclobacillus cellulosilyticus]|uniref:Sulfate-binding protein n=1 Tax=Alicyclobacillus cellulosilyticus TaxID=1003997 RepID=A0A917NLJ3_9BACL|nr:sulfate ABC transporter substrate-binding protein [Alicyclobacillus cellulosilyticus]GGJ09696.1 sulfate-binding protein [Alicyclobacillus cellulosilyticus]